MIVYHGTTDDSAKQIAKDGLKPMLSKSFNLMRMDNFRVIHDKEPAIYVALRKDVAIMFAEFRAQYERARPMQAIPWGYMKMVKAFNAPVNLSASPVVVSFNLPPGWDNKFQPDWAATDFDALTSSEAIPAEYVSSVEPIRFLRQNPASVLADDIRRRFYA